MYHRIIVCGNIGTAPEERVKDGRVIVTFLLAANHFYRSGDDKSKKSQVIWFRATAFGNVAEACKLLNVGDCVLVDGFLSPDVDTGRPRAWVGDDGKAYASYDMVVTTVRFLTPKNSKRGKATLDTF